jgi:hypothetical protein
MGLFEGAPSLRVHPGDPDLETADRLWPIVRSMIENPIFDGRDYLVEGVNLRPQSVHDFSGQWPGVVRACFLGYPRMTPQAKAAQVSRHAGGPNDWLSDKGSDYILPYLEGCIARSGELRHACESLGIPFFDTGEDFEVGLGEALDYLEGAAPRC